MAENKTIDALLKEGPSLTLDPAGEFKDLVVENEIGRGKQPAVFEEARYLTPEEIQQVDAFAEQIHLDDSASILQYGSGIQKKMSDFSEGTLEKVRNKDLGEIGDMLSGVVADLKEFGEKEEKGILGFFKKKAAKLEELKVKYDKAESNIEKVSKVLEGHQVQLLKDTALLDKLYDLNKVYFRELNMYILAGKKKLQQVMEQDMVQAREKAAATGSAEDAQAVSDLEALCNRFEKKIYDLELTRTISLQMAPQIRMLQSSNEVMAEKIQSTLVNTIPLWKSQMVIAIGVEHSKQAAEAQREVSDFTNALLKKNAERLKMATIETAKESERGIVDMETLIATNENLISTIDEVMKIQEEGRQKRKEAEGKLAELEDQLKKKLLSSSYR